MVTRRPLELRIRRIIDSKAQPYAIFEQDDPNNKITDFAKIKTKIEKLTEEVCGDNRGIVDKPIVLNVYSPSCPDLTLIDLPGITRIAQGGQAQNVEEITKNMAKRYCEDPRTIILCVVPANQDMSTSDGLQMAMKLDPKGERTIGVITKIDIMDRGTNAKRMILGEDIPLTLGYVGVKGRSQLDIQEGMKVGEAIREEKKWFAQHPVYSNMPQSYLGTDALINKLTTVMYRHIKKTMPSIIAEIDGKIVECEKNIKDLGTALPVEDREKLLLVWKLISDFTDKVKAGISGEYNPDIPNIKKDLLGGVRIKIKFNDVYLDEMSQKYKVSKAIKDAEIKTALRLHTSNSLPGFTSSEAFFSLISPLLQRLREPAMTVLEEVHVIMEQICIFYINETFQRFPMFINEITEATLNVLLADKERARLLINEIIDANIGYTYTKDPDYLAVIMPQSEKEKAEKARREEEEKRKQEEAAKAKAASEKGGDKPDKTKPVKEEEPEEEKEKDTVTINKKKAQKKMEEVLVKEMRNRIDAYYRVVATQLADIVPKLIGHNLVNSALNSLQFSVFKKCSAGNMFDLLKEPEHIVKKRETLKRILDVLTKSRKILLRDPDLAYNVQLMSEKEIKEDKERKKEEKKKKTEKGFFAKAGEFASDVGSKISSGVSDLKQKIAGKDDKPSSSNTQSSSGLNTSSSTAGASTQGTAAKSMFGDPKPSQPQQQPQPSAQASKPFSQKTEADLAMDAAKFAYQNKEAVAKFAKENPELANKAGNAIVNAALGTPKPATATPAPAGTAGTAAGGKSKQLSSLFGF